MLGPKYLQGCMFAFILLSILGLILEGAFLGSTENNLIDDLTKWSAQGGSWFYVPMIGASLLMKLPSLLAWDYSFFESIGAAGAIIRLILGAAISFGIVWGFFTVLLPIMANFLAQFARGLISLVR